MFVEIPDDAISRIDASYSVEKVKAVSMGKIETTTKDKKVLFTFGLATCVGIYVYSKDFGILGHIDSGDFFDQHFEHKYRQVDGKWERITGRFKQTGKILYEIRNNLEEIIQPLKIGMVLGTDTRKLSEEVIGRLDFAIDVMIGVVKDMGISIEKQEVITSSSVIIDTENQILKTEDPLHAIEKRRLS